ncbi:hypothetical protein IT409_02770 [Candidatus Falkowbacteria bacterium]|nr:hypothetical protein [Candidatus Falkowbacteria bacterium]
MDNDNELLVGAKPEGKRNFYEAKAVQILELLKDRILAMKNYKVHNLEGGMEGPWQNGMMHFMSQIRPEVLERFFGHGITRGNEVARIAALMAILNDHVIKGDSGRLMNSGHVDAFVAPIMILSKVDRPLMDKEYYKKHQSELAYVQVNGWKPDIGAIVLDVKYYPLAEELKKRKPEFNIIKSEELPAYFQSQLPNERVVMTQEEMDERDRREFGVGEARRGVYFLNQ